MERFDSDLPSPLSPFGLKCRFRPIRDYLVGFSVESIWVLNDIAYGFVKRSMTYYRTFAVPFGSLQSSGKNKGLIRGMSQFRLGWVLDNYFDSSHASKLPTALSLPGQNAFFDLHCASSVGQWIRKSRIERTPIFYNAGGA